METEKPWGGCVVFVSFRKMAQIFTHFAKTLAEIVTYSHCLNYQ